MKSGGMRWIIPAVIVAIAALIIFQVNWLVREAEMKKEDEKRRIGEALRLTCIEMEKREARGFIGNSLDSVFIRHPHPGGQSIRTSIKGDSMQQVIVIDDAAPDSRLPRKVPAAPVPPLAPLASDSIPVPAPPPLPEDWVFSNDTALPEVNAQIMVMQRKESMKSAMEDVMMEYVFNAGVPSVIDTAALDSILESNLSLQGIEYKYSSSIVPGGPVEAHLQNDSLRARNEWLFHSRIYPGAPDPFAPQLIVEINPGNNSVVRRILPQLIFSLLITAGMLLLFLLIYREALKQKKMADIRRDFINNMTHEFKTPLATMSLAADTIMNEKVIGDKDKVKYYAEQIKAENKKLNQQVEKVLELALSEKTGVSMNKERVNLTEIVLRAIKSMEIQVESKRGTLVLTNQPEILLFEADAFHLERVFVNLIDNALKYGGNPPRITVTIESFRSGIQVTVADNGSGIPQSEWELIFEPFYRVSTGDVHNVKGFGVGLSYAKSVIKEHSGSISVTKSDASGTIFTVVLLHGKVK